MFVYKLATVLPPPLQDKEHMKWADAIDLRGGWHNGRARQLVFTSYCHPTSSWSPTQVSDLSLPICVMG